MKRTAWPRRLPHADMGNPISETKQAVAHAECAVTAIKKIVKGTAVMAQISRAGPATAIPKTELVRNEEYRRLVAAMPCRGCGIEGFGQAAHANTGKGMGMKTDDRTCFSLCADRPGTRGCHSSLDQGAMFTKEDRQRIELMWAAQTRRQIEDAGQWPKNLPKFETKDAAASAIIA